MPRWHPPDPSVDAHPTANKGTSSTAFRTCSRIGLCSGTLSCLLAGTWSKRTCPKHTYVVTSRGQLDQSVACIASLPVVLGCHQKKLLCCLVLRTGALVRWALTNYAGCALARFACGNVVPDGSWRNKCRARRDVTVCSIWRVVLHLLCLVLFRQLGWQETLAKTEGHQFATAARGEQRLVRHGCFEELYRACVTVVVRAGTLHRFLGRDVCQASSTESSFFHGVRRASRRFFVP